MTAALLLFLLLTSGEECSRFLRFRPLGIGVLGQTYELAVIFRCLGLVAGGFRGARNSEERAIAIWSLLQRGLEFFQRCGWLTGLEQQFSQQFAERIEAVLHRHVLDAAVLAVRGCAHQLERLIARAFLQRNPGRDREDLLLRTIGPIGLIGLFERGTKRFDRLDLGLCAGKIAV